MARFQTKRWTAKTRTGAASPQADGRQGEPAADNVDAELGGVAERQHGREDGRRRAEDIQREHPAADDHNDDGNCAEQLGNVGQPETQHCDGEKERKVQPERPGQRNRVQRKPPRRKTGTEHRPRAGQNPGCQQKQKSERGGLAAQKPGQHVPGIGHRPDQILVEPAILDVARNLVFKPGGNQAGGHTGQQGVQDHLVITVTVGAGGAGFVQRRPQIHLHNDRENAACQPQKKICPVGHCLLGAHQKNTAIPGGFHSAFTPAFS